MTQLEQKEELEDFLIETWAAVCAAELWDKNSWWKTYWLPKADQFIERAGNGEDQVQA